MSNGINYEKICTRIKDDGYRCGKPFYSKRNGRYFCDECKLYPEKDTLKSRAGLVRSTNRYVKSGNDEKMRDFIIKLMATHEDDRRTIAKLEEVVESLSNRLTLLEDKSEHLKLTKDIEKLKRQNTVNENKIKSLKKLIHRMKAGE
tara:strand:- start:55 stop:492 length:438 start_codon:yes stop_codon:yes gene_type:complete